MRHLPFGYKHTESTKEEVLCLESEFKGEIDADKGARKPLSFVLRIQP